MVVVIDKALAAMLHDFAAPLPQAEEELPPHVHFHSSKPSTLLRTRATHTEGAGSRRGGAASGGGGGVPCDVARVLAREDRGAPAARHECRCARSHARLAPWLLPCRPKPAVSAP